MRTDLLRYLEARVPRYTSYPTAAQFGPDVGAQAYSAWLGALSSDEAVSLYLHVPFCAALCLYCGCHTTVVRSYAPVAAYVDLLEREIEMVAAIVGRRAVSHLHWGGGTPTLLTPEDLLRVMALLRNRFSLRADAELAVEIDPRAMTETYAGALARAGITRVSLGVQDFDERVQRAVGRLQSFDQTARVVDWLRQAGISGINLDLMYGLPYQTTATLEATLRQALALAPERIALFGYAHVPWLKRHQKLIPEAALPDTAARFEQARTAAQLLSAAGYQPIGIDHFARRDDALARRQRAGSLHRNFQGYTSDDARTLLAFGTSAIGSLPQGYVQNAANTVHYREMLAAGTLPVVRGCAVTPEDRLRRDVIESLMCHLAVDLAEMAAAHNARPDRFAAEFAALDRLAEAGIVARAGPKIAIPDDARAFVRTVCAVFDQYLRPDESRFSRAS